MRQENFRARYEAEWGALDEQLKRLETTTRAGPVEGAEGFPAAYRRVCQHLALARQRGYSAALVRRLNSLALRGHEQLYARRGAGRAPSLRAGLEAASRSFRREWRLVVMAQLLFYGPFAACTLGVILRPDFVYSVLDPSMVANLEAMYDPDAAHFLRERASGGDVEMFGFYIRNNVGIAFRTFAGGMLAGAGSVFFLVFNGLVIGASAGHATAAGMSSTFWSFVSSHAPYELTAIALSGACGLKLGLAPLAPGRRTRREALVVAARSILPLVYAAGGMLVVAAFVEAFWSSSRWLPNEVKYVAGAAGWVAVFGWLVGMGGRRGS